MKSEPSRLGEKFEEKNGRAVHGSQEGSFPDSSLYKDGAKPHSDANSFLSRPKTNTGAASTADLPSTSPDTYFPPSVPD